jgi:hypothetical protein
MSDTDGNPKIELTVEERKTLQQIASAEPPNSSRALAILALADGADLAGAGTRSGLTSNQVRYWSGRFGTRRLSIFPEGILEEEAEDKVQAEPPLLGAPEETPLLEAPEVAGVLPETLSDDVNTGPSVAAAAAVAATGGAVAAKSKKAKGKKDKKSKKDKKGKKEKNKKKDKKDNKGKKDKKEIKKKIKNIKKGKKEEKSKKNKKNKNKNKNKK